MGLPDSEWEARLGRIRGYLRILAGREIHPKIRAKVDPSDVVQETLLEAHAKRDQIRGQSDGEIIAWLQKALAHNLADLHRKYGRAKRDVDLERAIAKTSMGLEAIVSARISTEGGRAARQEELLRLVDALDRIPEMQRKAVELHHLDGLPVKEVAERLGKSAPAVAGLIHRGLISLREALQDGRMS